MIAPYKFRALDGIERAEVRQVAESTGARIIHGELEAVVAQLRGKLETADDLKAIYRLQGRIEGLKDAMGAAQRMLDRKPKETA